MPTYEYRCAEGHDFEVFQKMSDDPLTECPECGAPAERKISSGAGLVFKGSGFYITDYKKTGEKKGKAAEGKGEGATADAGSGSDSKGEGSGSSGASKKSSGSAGEGKKGSSAD
ncbi:MAG: FmdB family zinc ribbon protein [Gemmatimonadota bacterium]|nr:FmdB family zinc ribbon protein [Gemmatimonadota bacterium]